MSFSYTLKGPNAIVLDLEATTQWAVGCQNEIKDAAQKRADGMGHVCSVWSVNMGELLDQVCPTKVDKPVVPVANLAGLAKLVEWLHKNVDLDTPDDG